MSEIQRQFTPEQQAKVKKERSEKEHYEMLRAAQAKIIQGIARNNERSGERAIWELMQNAGDLSDSAVTRIVLTSESIQFSHKGEAFDLDSLSNLIKQQSTKSGGEDKVGQYGTGFMATHVFSKKVYISGDCHIKCGGDEIYVPLPDGFCLDRSSDDDEAFIEEMDNELICVNDLIKCVGNEEPQEWTTFKYEIDRQKAEKVSGQLDKTIRLMPFVLTINDKIFECTIDNKISDRRISYRKLGERLKESCGDNYCKVTTKIEIVENDARRESEFFSIETKDGLDRIIIPPLPIEFDDVAQIPSHFIFFPMLGTEKFGTNFIFHSSRLFPTEQRNSFLLPQDNDGLIVKYKHNEKVLDEMIDMLFDYYRNNVNEQKLPIDFAKVEFSYTGEDNVTKEYYEKLQKKFSEEFVTWEMIPTDRGCLSIKKDSHFAVLENKTYEGFSEEQLSTYIPIISGYASKLRTIPSEKVAEWSKVVYGWDSETAGYYITIKSICDSVKEKSDDLKTFLLYLKDFGKIGTDLLASNALIPNRKGDLRKSTDLVNGKTITKDLYEIAEPIIGEYADRIVDEAFADVVDLSEYGRKDLRDNVTSAVEGLRRNSIEYFPAPKLVESRILTQLIKYCSAFLNEDSKSYRAKLMPIICDLYGEEYSEQVIPPASQESPDPDLYSTTFNFLVDNTMLMLSQKPITWFSQDNNRDLLYEFLKIFTDTAESSRLEKLDKYGILPNQLGKLNKGKDLKLNVSVDDELQQLYLDIFKKDLKTNFVDEKFGDFYKFGEYTGKDAGVEIEKELEERDYKGTEILTIIKHLNEEGDDGKWKTYFSSINAMKEGLYYSHGSKEDKEALYRIQMQGSEKMQKIANLMESEYFEDVMEKAQELISQQEERDRQFRFTYMIGKAIENEIRKEIGEEIDFIYDDLSQELTAEDEQYGQDVIIRYRGRDIYHVECKAKWNFNEPAHMSSLQMKQSVRKKGRYALCCIDCTKDTGCTVPFDATEEEIKAAHDDILNHTYVHFDIGDFLSPTLSPAISQEDDPTLNDEETIKVYSSFSCNIPKKVFIQGIPFGEFIELLKAQLKFAGGATGG